MPIEEGCFAVAHANEIWIGGYGKQIWAYNYFTNSHRIVNVALCGGKNKLIISSGTDLYVIPSGVPYGIDQNLKILKLNGPHEEIRWLPPNSFSFILVNSTTAVDESKQYLVDSNGSLLTFDLSEEKLSSEPDEFRN